MQDSLASELEFKLELMANRDSRNLQIRNCSNLNAPEYGSIWADLHTD